MIIKVITYEMIALNFFYNLLGFFSGFRLAKK